MHDLVCVASQCAPLAYNGSSRRMINYKVKRTWPTMDITQLWRQLGQGFFRGAADCALQRKCLQQRHEVTSRTVKRAVLKWRLWLPLNQTTPLNIEYLDPGNAGSKHSRNVDGCYNCRGFIFQKTLHVCTYTYTYVHINTCKHTHTYTYTYVHIHTCTHTHMYTYTYCIYTCTHTHM